MPTNCSVSTRRRLIAFVSANTGKNVVIRVLSPHVDINEVYAQFVQRSRVVCEMHKGLRQINFYWSGSYDGSSIESAIHELQEELGEEVRIDFEENVPITLPRPSVRLSIQKHKSAQAQLA